MSFLSVNNITAGYGKQNVIENVSFEIERGCLVGVLGANGSGKTTLLKAICGIITHRGNCMLANNTLENLSAKELAKLISYIPQRSGISIDISALDVVLMGFNPHLRLLEHPNSQMKRTAMEMLEKVGLLGKENMNYMHLSEGQKQLCILARTLVSECKVLLLDEPESALDFNFRYKMLTLLKSLVVSEKRSAVVTLHDPSLALNFCDKLLLLSDGTVLDVIEPQKDSFEEMEQKISRIYGNVSLHKVCNKKGGPQIVMLRED